jgi:hypothetical protein
MSEAASETVTDVARIEAPYRREIVLQDVLFESGMRLMRVRIREGRRFTILDVDAPTAEIWGRHMIEWAQKATASEA